MKSREVIGIVVLVIFVGDAIAANGSEPGDRSPSVSVHITDPLSSPANVAHHCDGQSQGVGSCGSRRSDLHRAGHPECVHRFAVPSGGPRYGGYSVGGGLPWFGELPCADHDGTWGWDYLGAWSLKRVRLNWGHGARSQGGSGAYRTDGPRVIHR